MEDQLGALGLVLIAIVLRTTKYLDAAAPNSAQRATNCGTRTSPTCPRSSTAT